MIENLFWIGFMGAILALAFAFLQARRVLKNPKGTGEMQRVAAFISKGANVYLKRQCLTVFLLLILVFSLLLGLTYTDILDNPYIPYAFLSGGILSLLSGFVGVKLAASSGSRTAYAAVLSLNESLTVAFTSGTVMGFTVVGLGLLDISVWFHVLKYYAGYNAAQIAQTMVMFGIGASFVSLFSRVGGGVFAKAADLGADLAGRSGADVSEDDLRNPAAVADQVGDSVSDVAGMGADLYESYICSILAAFALGASAYAADGMSWRAMLLPLAVAVAGAFCSLMSALLVRVGERAGQRSLLRALRMATYSAAALTALVMAPATYLLLGSLGPYLAILSGLIAGCAIGYLTEYCTSEAHKPTRRLSASAENGAAATVMGGFSLGLKSTMAPIAMLVAAIIVAFLAASGLLSPADRALFEVGFSKGFYGIGLAAVGMLSTTGIVLSSSAYGSVADNAGGVARMARLGGEVQGRADALNTLGNTAAATGKSFAIGSAALTSLALIVSCVDILNAKALSLDPTLTNPAVLVGVFAGVMLAFLFAALTLSGVQKAATSVVTEVRRQFKEIRGILSGKNEPNYALCVDRCTKWALFRAAPPILLAMVVPLGVGLLLGPEAVLGLLVSVTVTGFALALFLSNAGSAWGNAKRYRESAQSGDPANSGAAVTGDMVGDPFKDVAGPSLNILMKLCVTLSLVFSSLIVGWNLISLLG